MWSIPTHLGKLRQQHKFVNASFVILVLCHFLSTCHVDDSENNVMRWGGQSWEIAEVHAINFFPSSPWSKEQFEPSQTKSQNFIAQRVSKFREKGTILKRSPADRTPTLRTDEKKRTVTVSVQHSPKPQQRPRFWDSDWGTSFCSSRTGAAMQCACTPAVSQNLPPRYTMFFAEPFTW